MVVAECVRRFGDCANDGSSGYWATVPQLALSTSASASAIKPYPHLFTDHCFAHLMVAYRSPDWQVVRQVTVVILNLLEERLIYGIDAYESSHLRDGASEEERLALKFAPITETQLCMFHDVAFQMLCAFCGEQALILSSIWCVHNSLVQAFGEEEIFASIPFVLALESIGRISPGVSKRLSPRSGRDVWRCLAASASTFSLSGSRSLITTRVHHCGGFALICSALGLA